MIAFNRLFRVVLSAAALFFALSGCSAKKEEFNKSADYWYQKMVKEIARGDLELADGSFTSLQSEHMRSVLIPDALQILSQAHMDRDEYLLAGFYLDEYLKRYGDKRSAEYIKFQKVKAGFLAFRYPLRDQQLLLDTVRDSEAFMKEYPNSVYRPFVETMVLKLSLASKMLNENIAALYKRVDKPVAAQQYSDELANAWFGSVAYEKPKTSLIRRLFELQ